MGRVPAHATSTAARAARNVRGTSRTVHSPSTQACATRYHGNKPSTPGQVADDEIGRNALGMHGWTAVAGSRELRHPRVLNADGKVNGTARIPIYPSHSMDPKQVPITVGVSRHAVRFNVLRKA